MSALSEFEAGFTLAGCRGFPVSTFLRDADVTEVESSDSDLLPWALAVPDSPDAQQLTAIKLKWLMDCDEMFYYGDNAARIKGLLTGAYQPNGAAPDWVLLDPALFAEQAIAGMPDGKPCKWLKIVGARQFSYRRSQVKFKLAWPKLGDLRGTRCFIGGIGTVRGA